jgi:hypothetical protein
MHSTDEAIFSKIHDCRTEPDIDKQVSILKDLNLSLPFSKRLLLQSVYTDDYIERMLVTIEDMT